MTAQLNNACAVTVTIEFQYADPNHPFRATHGRYSVESKAKDGSSSPPSQCFARAHVFVNVPTDKGADPHAWLKGMEGADPAADVTPISRSKGQEPDKAEHKEANRHDQWVQLLHAVGADPSSHSLVPFMVVLLGHRMDQLADSVARVVRASDAYQHAQSTLHAYRELLQAMHDKRNDLKGDDLASAKEELTTARRLAVTAHDALNGHYVESLQKQIGYAKELLNGDFIGVVKHVLESDGAVTLSGDEQKVEDELGWQGQAEEQAQAQHAQHAQQAQVQQ